MRDSATILTQIYEVSTPEEARLISEIGVDHVGVLVGKGEFPRELSIETALEVAEAVSPPSKWSALFLIADIALIEECSRKLQPSILHLGAAPELLSPQDVASIKGKLADMILMRSIPMTAETSIANALNQDSIVDFLLLDSHQEADQPGSHRKDLDRVRHFHEAARAA